MYNTYVIFFVLACVSVWAQDLQCEDIDTSACQLLESSQPDFCSDVTLAQHTCPRYCKLCPIECYHCNSTVFDYHECNTTMLCGENEVCMIKELKSFVDGHHEYEMTCEQKQLCDGGSMLSIPFVGKRKVIENRDISVSCCDADLCNYPGPRECPKDIAFMVDVSSIVLLQERIDLIRTLFEVVSQMDIGIDQNLVALYGYDSSVHKEFDLKTFLNKNDLLRHIQTSHILTSLDTKRSDADEAVQYLVDRALTPSHGDRADFPDAVVIFGDSTTARNTHVSLQNRVELQKLSQDVIVVSVGPGSTNDQLASDSHHMIHVPSSSSFDTVLVPQLVNLLTQC